MTYPENLAGKQRVVAYVKHGILVENITIDTLLPLLTLKLKTFTLAFIYNEFTSHSEGRLSKSQSQRHLYQALDAIQDISHKLVIMGDFNIHWELSDDKLKRKLSCWCAAKDIFQVQKEPTRDNAILDLVLLRNIDNLNCNYTLDEI
jgi:exonuclease III